MMINKKLPNFGNYINLYRYDLIAIFFSIFIGIVLSTIPHILWFFKTGDLAWFADGDDTLYLAYASDAYDNHPLYLSDPVLAQGGSTMYPWLQFIPGVMITKLLGISPVYTNIIWRIWAGVSIPLSYYLLVNSFLKNTWKSFAATIILITDIGTHSCWLIYLHFASVINIAMGRAGDFFLTKPQLLDNNWRIITPGLSFAYVLLHLWLVYRAITKPNRNRLALAVFSFGLLFYVYFYFWTCAALALFISILLDSKNRKNCFIIGIFGCLLGMPQLIENALIKLNSNQDWLPRTDNFLPISHFSEILLPSFALLWIVITFFWVFLRRKDLIHLWSFAMSGLLLTNNQVITGLQFNNFHWGFCYGPAISVLIIIMFYEELIPLLRMREKVVFFLSFTLLSLYLVTGLWLRTLEATRTKESIELTTAYHKYIEQRFEHPIALEPRAVVAGSEEFVKFSLILDNQRPLDGYSVELSPAVNNSEWDERIALDSYLQGVDRSTFLATQNLRFSQTVWGPWARDKSKIAEHIERRLKYFDEIAGDLMKAINRFQVKYVILPHDKPQPDYLHNGWQLLQNKPYWQIWQSKLEK